MKKTINARVFVQLGSHKVEVSVPVELEKSRSRKMFALRDLASKALRMIATE